MQIVLTPIKLWCFNKIVSYNYLYVQIHTESLLGHRSTVRQVKVSLRYSWVLALGIHVHYDGLGIDGHYDGLGIDGHCDGLGIDGHYDNLCIDGHCDGLGIDEHYDGLGIAGFMTAWV